MRISATDMYALHWRNPCRSCCMLHVAYMLHATQHRSAESTDYRRSMDMRQISDFDARNPSERHEIKVLMKHREWRAFAAYSHYPTTSRFWRGNSELGSADDL